VLCVGETLDERRAGRAEAVVAEHLAPVVEACRDDPVARMMVAYEPVWAIGTGETATPDDASAMHAFIRERFAATLGQQASDEIRILYGGSVKPDNAAELLRAADVDGVLVGGASLDATDFVRICHAVA
jgi:triosephosphate isomerase (TIM)